MINSEPILLHVMLDFFFFECSVLCLSVSNSLSHFITLQLSLIKSFFKALQPLLLSIYVTNLTTFANFLTLVILPRSVIYKKNLQIPIQLPAALCQCPSLARSAHVFQPYVYHPFSKWFIKQGHSFYALLFRYKCWEVLPRAFGNPSKTLSAAYLCSHRFVGYFKEFYRVLETINLFVKALLTLFKQAIYKGIHRLFSLLQFLVICLDKVSDLEDSILQNSLKAFWKFLPLPVIIYHSNFYKGLHITINISTM